jgi:hypothetical protein
MSPDQLILSATGRPVIKVGDLAHAQFREGQYAVSIEWYQEGRSCEPVMAIWSQHGGREAGVFGICLSSIGKYADPSGNPTKEAFIECWNALPTLGMAQLDMEVYRLLDVILRHTPDLIRCPPAPPAVKRAQRGEAMLEIKQVTNGVKVDEAVI